MSSPGRHEPRDLTPHAIVIALPWCRLSYNVVCLFARVFDYKGVLTGTRHKHQTPHDLNSGFHCNVIPGPGAVS